jgi:L-methionine (R)-S-oxide reductase
MSAEDLITEISELVAAGGSDSLPEVLDRVLAHFDCVTGTVHLLGEDGVLELLAQRGIPESILPMVSKIPVGKGMAGLAAERRKPVQVCNLQTDESGDVRPGAKDTRMEGSVAAPMFDVAGELMGTLGVAKPVAYEFSDEEMTLLETLGRTIVGAL